MVWIQFERGAKTLEGFSLEAGRSLILYLLTGAQNSLRFVMHGMGEWAGHGGLFFKNEEHWRKRMQKVIVKAGGGTPQPVPSREAFGTHTVAFRPPYISTGANQAAPSFRS